MTPPVEPGGGGVTLAYGWGDPIRTTGQKAWHSEYSLALDSVDAAHTFTFEIKFKSFCCSQLESYTL